MLQKLVNLKNVQYPWYPGASPCRDVHFLARSKKKGAKIKNRQDTFVSNPIRYFVLNVQENQMKQP